MKISIVIKLVAIPLYTFIYNIALNTILINSFQNDHFVIHELNALLFLYFPILALASCGRSRQLKEKDRSHSKRRELFLGTIFFICFSICNTFIQTLYAISQFGMKELLVNQSSFSFILQTLIGSTLVVPVIEELVFRKFLFPEVKKKFPSSFLLILTFSFMAAHLLQIIQFPTTLPFYFIISLLLNLFYLKDENIVHNIVFHSLTNLTATLTTYYALYVPTVMYIPIIFGTAIIMLILVPVLYQKGFNVKL